MDALVAARDRQHALRYAVRVRSVLPSILALAMALPGRPAPAAPPAAAPRSADQQLGGELVRVDLARRSVTVKTEGHDPREVEGETGPETRLVSRGRLLRLEDLHPGDRVVLAFAAFAAAADDGAPRRVRVIKVVARVAVPASSPLPQP